MYKKLLSSLRFDPNFWKQPHGKEITYYHAASIANLTSTPLWKKMKNIIQFQVFSIIKYANTMLLCFKNLPLTSSERFALLSGGKKNISFFFLFWSSLLSISEFIIGNHEIYLHKHSVWIMLAMNCIGHFSIIFPFRWD